MAILLLSTIIAGAYVYQTIYSPRNSDAFAASNTRLIPFQGRIASATGEKIEEVQSITFALYSDSAKTTGTLLWEETQPSVKIKPDGSFTTLVGSSQPIPDHVFSENTDVYLGIRIGNGPELKPRKQIASIGYSLNSATLNNMEPITDPESDARNAVLALDSGGNLVIGGGGDHKFQATDGEFSLSGRTLLLTTNPGSDSNVVLAPNGTGSIDFQKSLINTSDNGVISPGAVEVKDSFAVLANNEFEPAVLIDSKGTGDLLVASSSGTPKFIVSHSGNVGIGTDTPALPLSVHGSGYITERLGVGTLVPAATLDVRGESALLSGPKDFSLYVSKGNASGSASIKFQNNLSSRTNMGLFGDDKFRIQVSNNATTWAESLVIDNNNGNIGIGTANPGDKLTVAGTIAPSENGKYNLGSESNRFQKLYVNEIVGASTETQGFWQRTGTTLTPSTVTDSILLGATVESSAIIKLSGIPNTASWINSGNVGIGTTTPSYKLDVQASHDSSNITRFTNASSHSSAGVLGLQVNSSTPSTSNYFVSFQNGSGTVIGKIQGNGSGGVSYATTGSDFGEYFRKDDPLEEMDVGDLVCIGPNGGIKRCTNESNHIIGVISDRAGFVGNSKFESNPDYALVGLLGQVSVNTINDESIQPGDALTFSKIPGKAQKATQAGMIIGKVTEKGSAQTAEIALNPTWYDPEIHLASSGNVVITGKEPQNTVYDGVLEEQVAQIQNEEYKVQTQTGVIENIGTFANTITGKLKAGLIETENAIVSSTLVAKNVVVETLTINGQTIDEYISSSVDEILNSQLSILNSQRITSPLSSIDEIRTNIISPLDGNTISVDLKNDPTISTSSPKLNITNDETIVASFDNEGNARFAGIIEAREASLSGTLTSEQLTINKNATVSGTLHAGRIVADDIEGLNNQIATITKQSLESIQSHNTTSDLPIPSELTKIATLSAEFAIIHEGLVSFGPATFNQASVMDSFSIGTDFTFNNHSINVIGDDLHIQPLRQGGVSFLAGLVKIDTQGNMTIEGDLNVNGNLFARNASVENNLNVPGNISSNTISPLNDNISVLLASESAHLRVKDASNSSVFAVNPKGDFEASGSATISKLNLRIAGIAEAVSDTESIATGSAGTAKINPNRVEMTVYTPHVTENSLIYITPIGNSSSPVYLLRQSPQESFTVGISKPSSTETPFNWIIIN